MKYLMLILLGLWADPTQAQNLEEGRIEWPLELEARPGEARQTHSASLALDNGCVATGLATLDGPSFRAYIRLESLRCEEGAAEPVRAFVVDESGQHGLPIKCINEYGNDPSERWCQFARVSAGRRAGVIFFGER